VYQGGQREKAAMLAEQKHHRIEHQMALKENLLHLAIGKTGQMGSPALTVGLAGSFGFLSMNFK
jgi:hypothetical protein